MNGWEFVVWRQLHHGPEPGLGNITATDAAELRTLAGAAVGWFRWDVDRGQTVFVPMAAWKQLVAAENLALAGIVLPSIPVIADAAAPPDVAQRLTVAGYVAVSAERLNQLRHERQRFATRALELLMHRVGQSHAWSGWPDDWEYHLWRELTELGWSSPHWMSVEADERQELATLSAATDRWIRWDEDQWVAVDVPLPEWEPLYTIWRQGAP